MFTLFTRHTILFPVTNGVRDPPWSDRELEPGLWCSTHLKGGSSVAGLIVYYLGRLLASSSGEFPFSSVVEHPTISNLEVEGSTPGGGTLFSFLLQMVSVTLPGVIGS